MALFFDSEEMNISSENSSNGYSNSNITQPVESVPILFIIDIVTLVFVVPIHSYVIWLIVKGTGNGLAVELSSLNLSVCEVLGSLASVLLYTPQSFAFTVVFISGLALTLTGRPLFQCVICVERYLAVVHPLTFLKFKCLRYRLICCAFVWTVIFASCVVTSLILLYEKFYYLFIFTLAQFLFFLSIMLFSCLAVLRALKLSRPEDRNTEREEENHMKRRAFQVILIITVTMVILYVPSIIAILFYILFYSYSSVLIFLIMLYLVSLVGLVQPFLFLHRVGKLPCTKCC